MMVRVYMETHWTVMGIIWPVIVAFLISQAGLVYMLLSKRSSPTPFQWLVTTAASIILGNAILTLI